MPPKRGDEIDGEWFDWGDELDDDDDDDAVDEELLDWVCSTVIINPLGFLFLRTTFPPTTRKSAMWEHHYLGIFN